MSLPSYSLNFQAILWLCSNCGSIPSYRFILFYLATKWCSLRSQSPNPYLFSSHDIFSLRNSYANSQIYVYSQPWSFNFLRTPGIPGVSFFRTHLENCNHGPSTQNAPKQEQSIPIRYLTLKSRSALLTLSPKNDPQVYSNVFHIRVKKLL